MKLFILCRLKILIMVILLGMVQAEALGSKEGLAEFIHGADIRVNSILNNNGNDFAALASAIGTGNESWTASDQYATAYLAVKFLHSRIVASGQSDGIKHMTTWMKNQFDTSQGASSSGIDDYFQNFSISKTSGGNFLQVTLTLFQIIRVQTGKTSYHN